MSGSSGCRQPQAPDPALDQKSVNQAASRIGHTSPPDTPAITRVQRQPRSLHSRRRPVPDPNIRPVGNGHQFSYQPFELPSPGPSPTSSSSSSVASDDADEDESSVINYRTDAPRPSVSDVDDGTASSSDDESDRSSDAQSEIPGSSRSRRPSSRCSGHSSQDSEFVETRITGSYIAGDFIIEDVDPMDSDNDGLQVLQPTEIESNRSRSRSRQSELPRRIIRDMRNLNCDTETSDEEEPDVTEETFYKWQRYLRSRRVSLSSSIGKRTFSERSSDSDDSDGAGLDVNEVGSSARRMRKRLHRGSLLFQDPPEPRIDELEEPNSSEDELLAGQSLAQELPYWTLEIMEMEDSG